MNVNFIDISHISGYRIGFPFAHRVITVAWFLKKKNSNQQVCAKHHQQKKRKTKQARGWKISIEAQVVVCFAGFWWQRRAWLRCLTTCHHLLSYNNPWDLYALTSALAKEKYLVHSAGLREIYFLSHQHSTKVFPLSKRVFYVSFLYPAGFESTSCRTKPCFTSSSLLVLIRTVPDAVLINNSLLWWNGNVEQNENRQRIFFPRSWIFDGSREQ